MRRRLFTILSAMSMVSCVAMLALWGRSYFRSDFCTAPNGGYYRLSSNRGEIQISYWAGAPPILKFVYFEIGQPPHKNQQHLLSFSAHRYEWSMLRDDALDDSPPPIVTDIIFPHWSASALLAILPAIWWRRRNQHQPGTCRSCGYDLRATPNRCPECGRVPTARVPV
jgi:hypothetical protein